MVDRVTRDLEERLERLTRRAGLSGKIKEGDAVKTLNRSKALYGRVTGFKKRRGRSANSIAIVRGRTQPGASTQTLEVSVEDLDLIPEDELNPEDRRTDAN